jgi:hypothetical protein
LSGFLRRCRDGFSADMSAFFIWVDGQSAGPYGWKDLWNLRNEGTITEETLVRRAGDKSYISYAEMRTKVDPTHLPSSPLPTETKFVLIAFAIGAALVVVGITIALLFSGKFR